MCAISRPINLTTIQTHTTAHSTWSQLQNAVFFAGLIQHAQLKCWRTHALRYSLSFDNPCSETCWLPASACCRLICDLLWSHMLIYTLWQLRCIIRNDRPCCVQKMGKKNAIFCFFISRRSVRLCCIIPCHTVGRVRVPNSSLCVQQWLKHVPVDPHRPCRSSRDDMHAVCWFVCCCFIVSYN